MKIALGTVQFSTHYGIANTIGQIKKPEIKNILNFAKNSGVDTIDTAISYQSSEQHLGEIGVDSFKVITKLPEIPDNCKNLRIWIINHVQKSLNFLKVKTLSGLLLHRPMQLLDKDKKGHPFVRVGVESGGCSGLSYNLDFDKTKNEATHRRLKIH